MSLGKPHCRKCGPDPNALYLCTACVAQILVDLEKKFTDKVAEMEANYYLIRRAAP